MAIALIVVVGPFMCWLCGLVYYCHDAKKYPGRNPRACFKCCYPLCVIYMYDGCCAASTWISAIFCCVFYPATCFYANCCWAPREAYYTRHQQKQPQQSDTYGAYSMAPHQYDGDDNGYPAPYNGGSGCLPLQQPPQQQQKQQEQQAYVPPQVVLAVPQGIQNPNSNSN